MIEVLAAASEYYPLIKTGGLADVAGALPTALKPHGVTTRTLVPGYPAIMQRHGGAQSLHDFPELFGGHARVLGRNIFEMDEALEVKRKIGVVPEDLALFDHLTAREHLRMGNAMARDVPAPAHARRSALEGQTGPASPALLLEAANEPHRRSQDVVLDVGRIGRPF